MPAKRNFDARKYQTLAFSFLHSMQGSSNKSRPVSSAFYHARHATTSQCPTTRSKISHCLVNLFRLSVRALYPKVASIQAVACYFPDYEEGHYPDRDYFMKVVGTVMGKWLQEQIASS